MSDIETCPFCFKPPHDQTWRCETCGAEFTCPATFFTMPTGVDDLARAQQKRAQLRLVGA